MQFTKKDLEVLGKLVEENKNNMELQKVSGLLEVGSISLSEKIRIYSKELLESEKLELEKERFEISFDYEMQSGTIEDNEKNIKYIIPEILVENEKIEGYLFTERENEIETIERLIAETTSASDKSLMREDLETLNESEEDFVFSYYGTNGFIVKEEVELFNKTCEELIKSFQNYMENDAKAYVESHEKNITSDYSKVEVKRLKNAAIINSEEV